MVSLLTYLILIVVGVPTLVLAAIQLTVVIYSQGRLAKKLANHGREWDDEEHRLRAVGYAYADILVNFPAYILAVMGILSGQAWGYVFLAINGATHVYSSVFLFLSERARDRRIIGTLAFYTYWWGWYLYAGLIGLAFSLWKQIP
jgi:hypothetical protein